MQIKELEELLGTKLFERSARQVRLTGFGDELALRVRTIMQSIDELGDMARASHNQLTGRLRLGIIPTIAPYLLPTIVGNIAWHVELDHIAVAGDTHTGPTKLLAQARFLFIHIEADTAAGKCPDTRTDEDGIPLVGTG